MCSFADLAKFRDHLHQLEKLCHLNKKWLPIMVDFYFVYGLIIQVASVLGESELTGTVLESVGTITVAARMLPSED